MIYDLLKASDNLSMKIEDGHGNLKLQQYKLDPKTI